LIKAKKAFLRNLSAMINFARFEFTELPDFQTVQESNVNLILSLLFQIHLTLKFLPRLHL
jgi:hypothetical protein